MNKCTNPPTDKKLIIHVTDSYGGGFYCYNNEVKSYSYDVEGDLRCVVEDLIKIGFLNEDSVRIFIGDEIYKHIKIDDVIERDKKDE